VQTDDPNVLSFAEDVAFASPSAAAAVVYAGNMNGRIAWKVERTGQTYKEYQEGRIKQQRTCDPGSRCADGLH